MPPVLFLLPSFVTLTSTFCVLPRTTCVASTQRSGAESDMLKGLGALAVAETVRRLMVLAAATGSTVIIYSSVLRSSGAVSVTSTNLLSPD